MIEPPLDAMRRRFRDIRRNDLDGLLVDLMEQSIVGGRDCAAKIYVVIDDRLISSRHNLYGVNDQIVSQTQAARSILV